MNKVSDEMQSVFYTTFPNLPFFFSYLLLFQAIRDFMVTREAIFLLRETKKLVARKERMRTNTPLSWMPVLTPKEKRMLPLLETNYGVNTATKNYIFNSSIFAFDTILSKLQINL